MRKRRKNLQKRLKEFADDAKAMMDLAKVKNETEEESIELKEEAKVAGDLRKQEEAGEIREIMQGENKAAKEDRVRSERASEAQTTKILAKAKEAERKTLAQMKPLARRLLQLQRRKKMAALNQILRKCK